MPNPLTRALALGVFAALCLGALVALGLGVFDAEAAAKLNTAGFVAACIADPTVTEDPAFEGGTVTPKAYCDCVAGKLEENKLSQPDVDMLTKMHKEEISDSDAESHPTLEDLLVANEGFEDACKQSLGLSTDYGTDIEEAPMEEGTDDEAPVEDDGSPPE